MQFLFRPIQNFPDNNKTLIRSGVFSQAIWPHSGHYRPTEENFQEFQSFLKDNNVDLTDVKVSKHSSEICHMLQNWCLLHSAF
jgi:hypothetical protein